MGSLSTIGCTPLEALTSAPRSRRTCRRVTRQESSRHSHSHSLEAQLPRPPRPPGRHGRHSVRHVCYRWSSRVSEENLDRQQMAARLWEIEKNVYGCLMLSLFSQVNTTSESRWRPYALFRINLPPTLTSTSSLRKDLIAVKAVQAMMNGFDAELHNKQLRQPETASGQLKSIPTETRRNK